MSKIGQLTVEEVAEKLRYSKEHVRVLCREGKIKAYKPGKYWLIPEKELDRFLEGGARSD